MGTHNKHNEEVAFCFLHVFSTPLIVANFSSHDAERNAGHGQQNSVWHMASSKPGRGLNLESLVQTANLHKTNFQTSKQMFQFVLLISRPKLLHISAQWIGRRNISKTIKCFRQAKTLCSLIACSNSLHMFDMSNITACGWGTYADASQPCLMLLQFDYKTENINVSTTLLQLQNTWHAHTLIIYIYYTLNCSLYSTCN